MLGARRPQQGPWVPEIVYFHPEAKLVIDSSDDARVARTGAAVGPKHAVRWLHDQRLSSVMLLLLLLPTVVALTPPPTSAADVLVYGATPGGIVAAIAARRGLGPSSVVELIEPLRRIGGMIAGGMVDDSNSGEWDV